MWTLSEILDCNFEINYLLSIRNYILNRLSQYTDSKECSIGLFQSQLLFTNLELSFNIKVDSNIYKLLWILRRTIIQNYNTYSTVQQI
jgi:hypothetical protein